MLARVVTNRQTGSKIGFFVAAQILCGDTKRVRRERLKICRTSVWPQLQILELHWQPALLRGVHLHSPNPLFSEDPKYFGSMYITYIQLLNATLFSMFVARLNPDMN